MNQLSIGYAREIYSPDVPVPQNSQQTGYSVLTDVMVTCVCLSFGETKTLIFSNDLRNLPPSFVKLYFETVENETGIDRKNIMVSTTHNHSGPDVNFYKKNDVITDWVERICMPAVALAAKKAVEDLTPVAKLTSGKTNVEHANFVRRYFCEDGVFRTNPRKANLPYAHETEADTELRALRFYREGKKDVVIANFQVHAATALDVTPDVVTSDFLHAFRTTAEENGEFNVIYLQGGCGNINTYSRILPDACNKDYDRAGRLIGEGVIRALENEEERTMDSLLVQAEECVGVIDHSRDHLAKTAQAARLYIKENNLSADEAYEYYLSKGIYGRLDAGAIINKSKLEKTRNIPLRSICFGDVGITFAPFEMFDTNCQQIRAASPFAMTLTVGYSTALHGYLPSAFGFLNGGYEARQCTYIPGTGETVALSLVSQLKKAKDQFNAK